MLPGSGENRKVTLVAFEDSNGGIDGDIVDNERTKTGKILHYHLRSAKADILKHIFLQVVGKVSFLKMSQSMSTTI